MNKYTKNPSIKDVVQYYDETRFDYDKVWLNKDNLAVHFGFYDENAHNHSDALLNTNRVMANLADIKAGERVMDAGCGKGGSSLWIAAERGAIVTGITPVQTQIIDCEKFTKERGLVDKANFVKASYTDTPFEDNTFDVVWACESVCHAAQKSDFYKEAYRVLKPGGRLIMAEYIRCNRPLPPEQDKKIEDWLNRWAIADIDTALEHRSHSDKAGFASFLIRDYTKYARVSLRNLHQQSVRYRTLGNILNFIGVRSKTQHGNHIGSIYQWEALEMGAWFYGVVSCVK